MANIVRRVRAGTTAPFVFTTKVGGVVYDLTDVTSIVVNIAALDIVDSPCIITDAVNGECYWQPDEDELVECDETIYMTVTATKDDGAKIIWPCPDSIILIILPADGSPG